MRTGLRATLGVLDRALNIEGALSWLRRRRRQVRREWTKDEIKDLKAHSKARTPVVRIAKMTKRTVGALRQKALVSGIGLGHQR